MNNRKKILFLCTGNSCRSQMAEGWAKSLSRDDLAIYSAGIEKHGLNLLAVKAMAEHGIDITSHFSKLISELPSSEFDFVITVCNNAKDRCPFYPANTRLIHMGFDDPPKLAENSKTEEEAFEHYRNVCLQIRDSITSFIKEIPR